MATPLRVDVDNLSLTIDGYPILERAAMVANAGEFIGLVGPNGSGKSTLLRAIYRALKPALGTVVVGDENVWAIPANVAARKTAVVAQETSSDFEFTVRDIVFMGRHPHKRLLDRDTVRDWDLVVTALERVGMRDKAMRRYASLSGGEKQRVLLARALAQESQVLILDEPTNHLDIRAQLELLGLARGLRITTIAALHDLNLAARYCDRVYVVSGGRIEAGGATREVLQPKLLERVFGVRAYADVHPASGHYQIVFDPVLQAPPGGDEDNPLSFSQNR